ncbi:hypothetical protein G6F42_028796 [Rhizopus arrhizus]|nr:hypothetical protein G6F42_028796 [Rhizopus arrhizus]
MAPVAVMGGACVIEIGDVGRDSVFAEAVEVELLVVSFLESLLVSSLSAVVFAGSFLRVFFRGGGCKPTNAPPPNGDFSAARSSSPKGVEEAKVADVGVYM